MAAIPYSMAKHISDNLRWPNKFYWALQELLLKCNGLGFALFNNMCTEKGKPERSIASVKCESAYFVFHHIINRTLQFDKFAEFIRVKDIINGMPTNAIPASGLSERTIKQALNGLSQGDFLIKLKFKINGKKIITPLYGLNIPIFLRLIQIQWINSIDGGELDKDEYDPKPNRKASNAMLRGRALLACCTIFANEYEDVFKFLIEQGKSKNHIEDARAFTEQLKEHLPDISCCIDIFEEDIEVCKKIRGLRKAYDKFLEDGTSFESNIPF